MPLDFSTWWKVGGVTILENYCTAQHSLVALFGRLPMPYSRWLLPLLPLLLSDQGTSFGPNSTKAEMDGPLERLNWDTLCLPLRHELLC